MLWLLVVFMLHLISVMSRRVANSLSLLSSVHEVGLVKASTVELHARGVGVPFRENGIATIVRGVDAGRRGRIAFGVVVWLGVMVALARVEKPRVREVHHHARLPILGKVRPLLPECKLAKDGLPNLVVKIPSLSVFRPMLSLSC